jgi:hypothetical protein
MTDTNKNPSHIDFIDGNWARAALDFARRTGANSPVLDYGALASRLDRIRVSAKLAPADRRVAVLAVDYDNQNQRKLAEAVANKGISPVKVDFRHSYVSVPLNDGEYAGSKPQSLSHWITYMCGVLAVRDKPTVVVVSGAFELAGPLADFVERGGTAVVAFFKRLLDKRWIDNGLLADKMPVSFVDLEPYSGELLGVNLQELVRRNTADAVDARLPI